MYTLQNAKVRGYPHVSPLSAPLQPATGSMSVTFTTTRMHGIRLLWIVLSMVGCDRVYRREQDDLRHV